MFIDGGMDKYKLAYLYFAFNYDCLHDHVHELGHVYWNTGNLSMATQRKTGTSFLQYRLTAHSLSVRNGASLAPPLCMMKWWWALSCR